MIAHETTEKIKSNKRTAFAIRLDWATKSTTVKGSFGNTFSTMDLGMENRRKEKH